MARVAFIVDDLVEEAELRVPLEKLGGSGHEVVVVGAARGKRLQGRHGQDSFIADRGIDEVDASEFDALVIPGGYSPDRLRMDERMVDLVRDAFDAGKPIAAICRGPSMLVEADVVDGVLLTSWPSIRTDLINAGADWVDEDVVQDDNIITARKPADLPAFCDAILQALQDQAQQRAANERVESRGPARPGGAPVGREPDIGSEAIEHGVWRGGEGEGRPETHDLGGLEQRDRILPSAPARGPADNEAAAEPTSEEEWLSGRQDEPALRIDAGVEAGATTGPHAEERITLADVEALRRGRAEGPAGGVAGSVAPPDDQPSRMSRPGQPGGPGHRPEPFEGLEDAP